MNRKKMTALLMALVLVLPLVACGGKGFRSCHKGRGKGSGKGRREKACNQKEAGEII